MDETKVVDLGERLEEKACIGGSPVPVLRSAAKWAKEHKATVAAIVVIGVEDDREYAIRFLSEDHGDDRLFVELSLMLDDVRQAIRDKSEEG